MIYSLLNRPKAEPTPAGSTTLPTYTECINKKTQKLELERTGEIDVYAKIQEHHEECKIENIMKRAAMGDMSALQQKEGIYVDTTNMPKTLMEANNLVIQLQNEFYELPIEVRKEFDNSADVYVAKMGSKEYNEIMGKYNEQVAKIAEEKNFKEYQKKVKEGAKLNYDIAREQKALEGVTE